MVGELMENIFDETITIWSLPKADQFITRFCKVAKQYNQPDNEIFLAYWTDRNLFELVGFIDRHDDMVFGVDDVYVTPEDALILVRRHCLRIVTIGKTW
jgi:hypothetical protein